MDLSRFLILFIAFQLILQASCQNNTAFKQSIPIDSSGWAHADIVKFSMDIEDTVSWHNLVLRIGHSTEYPFQNLYVRVHTIQPEADSIAQPVSLELADRTGRWQGRCAGNDCEVDVMLQEKFRFQFFGKYQIWVEQFMRQPSVSGIQKVSLLLEKVNKDG